MCSSQTRRLWRQAWPNVLHKTICPMMPECGCLFQTAVQISMSWTSFSPRKYLFGWTTKALYWNWNTYLIKEKFLDAELCWEMLELLITRKKETKQDCSLKLNLRTYPGKSPVPTNPHQWPLIETESARMLTLGDWVTWGLRQAPSWWDSQSAGESALPHDMLSPATAHQLQSNRLRERELQEEETMLAVLI